MVVRRLGLLLLLAGCAGTAAAADGLRLRPGMGGVPDLGAIDCATFNHMHPAGPAGLEQAVLTWAEGYFYARSGKTLDEILAVQPAGAPGWDFDRLTGQLVGYCAANPQSPVPEAVASLWEQLAP